MSFHRRMADAHTWEEAVTRGLQRIGWKACRYGQGMLTDEVRDALRRIDTPIRWHPDVIAIRGDVAYFVDAKAGREDTPNHSIERSSLAAFHDWYMHSRIPVVIVWRDTLIEPNGQRSRTGHCAFTWELLADEAPLRPMAYVGEGSGTPGWLWPKDMCHRFSEIFAEGAPAYGPPPEWRMRTLREAG